MNSSIASHQVLKRQKPIYFLIGLLCAQSLVFFSFEWKVYSVAKGTLFYEETSLFEIDYIPVTPPHIPQPMPQHTTESLLAQLELNPIHFSDNQVTPRGIDEDLYLLSSLTQGFDIQPLHSKEDKIESITMEPSYPGGVQALHTWFQQHFHYPEEAKRYEVEGVIWISFYVDETGIVTRVFADPTRAQLGYGIEEEAIRVLSNMGAWKPGYSNSRPTGMVFTLPIRVFLDVR
jgi:protein TonB